MTQTPAYDPENIFAKVLRGDVACNKIYEDDFVLAFHDIFPAAPVHALVIPKGSYINFDDFIARASPKEIQGFYQGVRLITHLLGLQEAGYRLISNSGVHGGQQVPHYHMHILGGGMVGPLVQG